MQRGGVRGDGRRAARELREGGVAAASQLRCCMWRRRGGCVAALQRWGSLWATWKRREGGMGAAREQREGGVRASCCCVGAELEQCGGGVGAA